jgi:hypothetical protein
VFLLCIKADVENIASLQPEEHHRWCLDVRSPRTTARMTHRFIHALMYSTHSVFAHALSRAQLKQSDGDEVRNGVYISDEEEHELNGSKARARRVRARVRGSGRRSHDTRSQTLVSARADCADPRAALALRAGVWCAGHGALRVLLARDQEAGACAHA